MSAEVLREAARLMRERAETAIRDPRDPRWIATPTIDPENHGWVVASDIPEADWDTTIAQLPYDYEGDAAPHVASWHPAVALAVADWLNDCAGRMEGLGAGRSEFAAARNVARAYLGAPS